MFSALPPYKLLIFYVFFFLCWCYTVYEYAQSRAATDPDMVDMLVEPGDVEDETNAAKKILFAEVCCFDLSFVGLVSFRFVSSCFGAFD